MQEALVIVPKALLYETARAASVSDELLSGWMVGIQQHRGDFLEITTQYGYRGWVHASAVRLLRPEECCLWELGHLASQGTALGNSPVTSPSPPAVIRHPMIDVLDSPKVQAKALATLFMGSAVIPLGSQKEGWQKVRLADGQCGYLPSCMLLPPAEKEHTQDSLRRAILEYACSFLGTPYRWGGKTREGIDCSGLTFMSYYMCGILIYRDAVLAEGYPVHAIPFSRVKPADLLYFPGHVALFMGDGKYIHSTGDIRTFGCTVNSLDPKDPDYRADLAGCLKGVGSIF